MKQRPCNFCKGPAYGRLGPIETPAAVHPAAAGQVFNVCTGRKSRILDLVAALRELIPDSPVPVFGPERSGDIYESIGSTTKAKAILGFEAETPLLAGLKETVEWMQ